MKIKKILKKMIPASVYSMEKENETLRKIVIDLKKSNEILKAEVKELADALNSKTEALNAKISDNELKSETKIEKIINESKRINYRIAKYLPKELLPEALCDWYFGKTGKTLDLNNPKTFNEKIQWTKIYDIDDHKSDLVDKYKVRDFVSEKIGTKYLIPLLGVWDRAEDIDFESLPEKFVLKCNHGSGFNIIVKDKSKFDIHKAVEKLNRWMHTDYSFSHGFEMQYSKINRKILAEEYMETKTGNLIDYKVFCFNGCPKIIMYVEDRFSNIKKIFFDENWNKAPFTREGQFSSETVPKPDNLNELLDMAKILSEGFIQCRIDFYRINTGEWKFSEITFTPDSGCKTWNPPEYELIIGDMIKLPEINNK